LVVSRFSAFGGRAAKADVDAWRVATHSSGMRNWIVLIACVSGSAVSQVPADPTPSNLTYRLEYASRDADAHHDCPSQRAARYAADFQQRYGERIKRLKEIHVSRSGADPDFIILTDCRGFTGSAAERDARHRKAMNDFEPTLRKLEQEFGGY
jgi:hypothetical protein